MAAPTPHSNPVGPDTPIIVKVVYDGENRRFKLPLRELGAHVFPNKLRQLLSVAPDVDVTFERYSDSAGAYIILDAESPGVYKQLYRAAKAKLRLRIKVTTKPVMTKSSDEFKTPPTNEQNTPEEHTAPPKYNYLDTVLSSRIYPPRPTVVADTASKSSPSPKMSNGDSLLGQESIDVPQQFHNDPRYRVFTLGQDNLSHPTIVSSHETSGGAFCIDCNNCGQSIPNEHYHCSICDSGDYDLCQDCVNRGALCPGQGHWLIKRIVQDGILTNSTTETIAPRKESQPKKEATPEKVPAPLPREEPDVVEEKTRLGERTCNTCFKEFEESKLVTCEYCPDYDLCITCLIKDEHGHNPEHSFALIQDRDFALKNLVMVHCRPGRHHRHAAICDGCDKTVIGVRHKCLNCPDWDYCYECIKQAPRTHPGHRFAPIYKPIAEVSERRQTHFGIFCDGPLCKSDKKYISGVRYKCAVCDDTDFCANCEAIPANSHNRTHPLIKFKTPVRHVSVSTFGEKGTGERMVAMGDQPTTRSTSTETMPHMNSTHAGTQVQNERNEAAPEVAIKAPEVEKEKSLLLSKFSSSKPSTNLLLQAHFVRDTIPDGTRLKPNEVITQTWTLYNPGPGSWPAGSSVNFVGGDAMFNVDIDHPSNVDNLHNASGSEQLLAPVPALCSADFSVTLKTPRRTGKAISYWRLKAPNGLPFGHKLWCDIDVQEEVEKTREAAPAASKTVEKDSDEVMKDQDEPELTGSAMIFPKLEKESPVASTHEAASTPSHVSAEANTDEQSIMEDVETLTLDDETDDGFLTDEEYDILDASDQDPTHM